MNGTGLMMFLLVIDILDNPFQVSGTKANDAVSALPLESLWLDLVIDVVRTAAFQLADPIRHENIRFEADTDMNVRVNTTDRVKIRSRSFDDLVRKVVIEPVSDITSWCFIRTLKRPIESLSPTDHVLKDVANCPSGGGTGIRHLLSLVVTQIAI